MLRVARGMVRYSLIIEVRILLAQSPLEGTFGDYSDNQTLTGNLGAW